MSGRVDSLEDLVRRAANVRDEDLVSLSDGASARALFEEVVSRPNTLADTPQAGSFRPRRARPKKSSRRIALLAAALLVIGGAAASSLNTAKDSVDEFGRGPALTPEDQLAQMDRLASDIPLPPGGSFDELRESIRQYPATMSREGFVGMLAYNGACQWYGYWLEAFDHGDDRRMAQALETIEEIPGWPGMGGSYGIYGVKSNFAEDAAVHNAERVRRHMEINC